MPVHNCRVLICFLVLIVLRELKELFAHYNWSYKKKETTKLLRALRHGQHMQINKDLLKNETQNNIYPGFVFQWYRNEWPCIM